MSQSREGATPEKSFGQIIDELFADTTPLLPPGVRIEIDRSIEWAMAGAQLGAVMGDVSGSLAAAEANERILWGLLGDDR